MYMGFFYHPVMPVHAYASSRQSAGVMTCGQTSVAGRNFSDDTFLAVQH